MQRTIKKIVSCGEAVTSRFKKEKKKESKTLQRKEIIRLGVRYTLDEYGDALKKLGSE